MTSPLLERLRHATRELHSRAERSQFMSLLLRGQLDRDSYRRLLINLQAIYIALESELRRHRGDAAVAAIWTPRLARAQGLALDLEGMGSTGVQAESAVLPSATAYVSRLHAIGSGDDPLALTAHAYVRYLGDLSGGQMLRRIVADKLGAPVAFYDFGTNADAQRLRADFVDGLAQMALTEAQVDTVVEEAITAFGRHLDLFTELFDAQAPTGPRTDR